MYLNHSVRNAEISALNSALKSLASKLSDGSEDLEVSFSNVMRGRDHDKSSAIISHFEGKLLQVDAAQQLTHDLRQLAASIEKQLYLDAGRISGFPLVQQDTNVSHTAIVVNWITPLVKTLTASTFAQNPGHEVLVIDAAKHYQFNYDRGDTLIFDVPGVRSVHDLATHLSAVDEQAGAVTLHFGETASIQLVGISQVADLHHGDLVFTG